jgi:hypothetical protein
VPEFTVSRQQSGRVLHSFSGLSPHHEIVLEPSEWRDAEESNAGRSLILWQSRTPGITLSMHRRPDGTFSGVVGGEQHIFEAIDNEAAQCAAEGDISGASEADVRSETGAQTRLELKTRSRGTGTSSAVDEAAGRLKAGLKAWITAWRSRSSQESSSVGRSESQHVSSLSKGDQIRAHTYSSMLCKAFAGLPDDWADSIARQVTQQTEIILLCTILAHSPRPCTVLEHRQPIQTNGHLSSVVRDGPAML